MQEREHQAEVKRKEEMYRAEQRKLEEQRKLQEEQRKLQEEQHKLEADHKEWIGFQSASLKLFNERKNRGECLVCGKKFSLLSRQTPYIVSLYSPVHKKSVSFSGRIHVGCEEKPVVS